MESSVFLSDLLTAHEPFSIVSFISNELCVQFMGSEHLEKLDVSWGHEPGRGLQSGTGFQPVSPEQASCLCHLLRFMGSLLSLLRRSDRGEVKQLRAVFGQVEVKPLILQVVAVTRVLFGA